MSQLFASGGQSTGASASASSPSNEYSGLISCWIDWFDLLALQGTLKSLLQHHNLKASILWRSAFFMVQLSHSYMTTPCIFTCDFSFLFQALLLLQKPFLPGPGRTPVSPCHSPQGVQASNLTHCLTAPPGSLGDVLLA